MQVSLHELRVMALDCQAGGATPAHGDLLELGWVACAGNSGVLGAVQSCWVVPRTGRRVPGPIRELTGWSEAVIASAIPEQDAWAALCGAALVHAGDGATAGMPAVIHYARFELPFLHDLHARHGGASAEAFPFDVICVHAIAARLFPELPRRNIRALAGYLGHSADLLRRSAGHVEATAFIWGALLPLLAERGISTWSALKTWLEEPAPARRSGRAYPLSRESRRSLPDGPGVYRFLRRNGDVLYVGKAASIRKRVASHFAAGARVTERALELLTQVHEVEPTETPSLLEAALLESDEIKRLDPPYNVQLRGHDRSAWFASHDLREAVAVPDAAHRIGPLPSQRALVPLWGLVALAQGDDSARLRAAALAVPVAYLPEEALFLLGWQTFVAEHLGAGPVAARGVERAARTLWLARGRAEPETEGDELAPDEWDLARVRRRLERNLVQTGLLMRRARLLCLLADATVAFREPGMDAARVLVVTQARIEERSALASVSELAGFPPRAPHTLHERRGAFDAHAYDRLRVLSTELRRVQQDGGEVALRIGRRTFAGDRLTRLLAGT
jgi:DNA polymerase-3 subunit epsilon